MLDLTSAKKNKVNLSDYNYQQDINDRIHMSDFSGLDVEVLEEILFSPLTIPFKKLARQIDCPEGELSKTLEKLSKIGLLTIQDDTIQVDKEKRKYFEFQIHRFDPDFKPDMEFLQGLLRRVPIQLLPNWYAVPRTSNNIFESIVEKYLFTPTIYQRYLEDLNFTNPFVQSIVNDLFSSQDFTISTTDLIAKYNLKREDFEEIVLLLELNFVAFLCYKKEDDHWIEYLSPFYEWSEYLKFLRLTETVPIDPKEKIERSKKSDFSFIEEMSEYLLKASKAPIETKNCHAVEKLSLLHLAAIEKGKLHSLDGAKSWLELSLEDKALFLYRHPQNRILSISATDRYIREAEKSIKRVLHGKWVYFDEFIKGVLVPLNENSVIMLKKVGKHWKYTLPEYGEKEISLLKATIFEWLFEMGMVSVGRCQGRDCFSVTAFGRFFFNE